MIRIKTIIFAFLLLLSLSIKAQSPLGVSPINVANILTHVLSAKDMRDMCRYYDLTELPEENGHITFTDGKGNLIRFRDNGDITDGVNLIPIEVITKESDKVIDKVLKSIDYKKHKGYYEKGSPHHNSRTVCRITSKGKTKILTFSVVKRFAKQ